MKIATQLAYPFEHQRQRKSREKCKEPPNISLVTLALEDNESMFSKFYGKKYFEPIILYPGKLALGESKIKVFSDMQRLSYSTVQLPYSKTLDCE